MSQCYNLQCHHLRRSGTRILILRLTDCEWWRRLGDCFSDSSTLGGAQQRRQAEELRAGQHERAVQPAWTQPKGAPGCCLQCLRPVLYSMYSLETSGVG